MQMRDSVNLFKVTLLTFSPVANITTYFPLLHHGLNDRQQLNIVYCWILIEKWCNKGQTKQNKAQEEGRVGLG